MWMEIRRYIELYCGPGCVFLGITHTHTVARILVLLIFPVLAWTYYGWLEL